MAWTAIRWSIRRCVSTPLVKKPGGPDQLDGVKVLGFHVRREPENLDERELGANAARGLDAVHPGHRDIHQDDIGPECARCGNRLESVGGFAHDVKFGPLLQQLAERSCAPPA